ncbi:hypothetical protein ACTIVE_7983 [Actinomadura verrucosospora]|uniref:Uncharacterized protein n=1 Tax=Actinomadura verrucosospora TaxID=46165 RepID=A0A7D3VYW7_ACTVE|nr:hypothetical protein ACTIVE_7983 [Actinomadura verrucosospora]
MPSWTPVVSSLVLTSVWGTFVPIQMRGTA